MTFIRFFNTKAASTVYIFLIFFPLATVSAKEHTLHIGTH
jgi:hypothetical protein